MSVNEDQAEHVGGVRGQHFIENYRSQGQEVDGDVPKIKRRPE